MNSWRALLIVGVVCAILAGAYVLSLHMRPVPGPFDGAKVIVLPYDGCSVRGISPNGTLALACDSGTRPALWSQTQGFRRLPDLPDAWLVTNLGVTDQGFVWGSYLAVSPEKPRYSFTWSPEKGLSTTKYHDTSVVVRASNGDGTDFRGHSLQNGVRRPCRVDAEGVVYPLNPTNLPASGMSVRFVSDDLLVMLGTTVDKECPTSSHLFRPVPTRMRSQGPNS